MPANHNLVKVAVLGLGGTIAMTRTAAGGVAPALSAAELVAAVSGLTEVAADLEVIDVRRLPGASLTVDDVRELYGAAEHAYAAGADGVVVTQGTDTIEETAYLLDLWHGGAQPFIVTGAKPRSDAHHNVGLVVVSLGDQGEMLHGISDRLDGLVVAGMGVGHVPAPLAPVLEDIAAKIPVVLATRTGAGPVLTATYAFPGSERDLQDRGLISAGFLDPLKARILLLAALRAGASRDAIAASFAVAGGYSSPARVTNVNRHHEH